MSRMTSLVREFLAHGRVPECPVIDMHTHPDRFHSIYFPHPDLDGILASMDRCGERLIAIAPHAALYEPAYGNPLMVKMLEAHPDRFRGYWVFNPNYPEELEEAKTAVLTTPGVIGFKLHPASHNYSLTGDAYQPLFSWANTHKLIVLSHTWVGGGICDADACRWVAERYPEMVFVMGHSCYPEFDKAYALARDFPNVYLELTACERMPAFVDRAVREVGAHKLLFGTDLPWFDPNFSIGCVLFADITDDDRHAILHGNAERLLAAHEQARILGQVS